MFSKIVECCYWLLLAVWDPAADVTGEVTWHAAYLPVEIMESVQGDPAVIPPARLRLGDLDLTLD